MIDFTIAAVSIVAVFAIYSIQVARKLSGIPGPFVARFTDYWKIYHMVKGDWAETICWWHQRHGPLIRIGPNALSVGDPTEVPQIYQTNPLKLLKKGHMYRGLTAWYKGRDVSGIEGIMDEGEHASIKKVVGQSFSWASVLDYEHLMDRSTMEFMDICQKLEVLDLNKWISYYTFDTMNGIAFSTDLGCMRQGTDVGGVLKTVEAVSGLWTYVAAAPTLFMWVARALSFFIGPSGPLVGLCLDRIRSRTENMQTEAYSESKRLDLLGVFLEARRSNPSMISHEKVIGLTLTTLLTGSETTSINLAWTVFFLLQNQTSLARLQEEIKTADLSYPPSLKDLCRLSYLSAVIKEGTRCASTVQLNLERIVPQGGMNLCDRYIPAGTTVGCHQRVIHLNQNVYGYDAAIFRPERWIESSEEVQRSMDRSGMWFGSGKHMCLGQHFARAGMMKLLSTMLMRFKVSAVDPKAQQIPSNSTLRIPAGSYYIRVNTRQDCNQAEEVNGNEKNMELLSSSKSHSKTASMAENPRKEMEKTTQLQENFSAATKSAQSSIHLNDSYHGPTDDLLTCDGVCYKTRPLCLEELKRVAANFTTREAANMTHRGQTWLQMAQAALGNMNEYKPNLSISALRPTVSSEDSFAWSTPEGAAAGMTGKVHNSLSLPEAMCGPLLKSHIQRDPLWVGYSITLITAKAAGCSFDMSVTRATSPVSRINQVQVMTGLQPVRVSNLATAALSGLFYLAHHKPEKMVGEARAVSTFFHGLAYADELSCPDQGGEWAHFGNLAGPLLAAEKLLSGPLPKLFEKVLFSYHCCTIKPQPPPLMSTFNSTSPSLQTLFLARFYDSTLPSYLDCFQFLEPSSVLMARATTWGTLLSNDVFDYVSDGISGRVANLCWAIGDRDSPIECARMFRGCLIALARTAHYDPGPLFALIYMEYTYLYTARYCYYSVPCDPDLPLDDTYIPYSFVDIPTPGTSPVHGFRAALREAFSPSVSNPPSDISDLIAPFSPSTKTNTANQSLPPWRGVAATPCAWDMASGDFDVTAMRATHEILACLDRQVYVDHPEVYRAHLGWMIRHYDSMVVAGRDNLGVGRYYIASRID